MSARYVRHPECVIDRPFICRQSHYYDRIVCDVDTLMKLALTGSSNGGSFRKDSEGPDRKVVDGLCLLLRLVSLVGTNIIQNKDLSDNIDAVLQLVRLYNSPATSLISHTDPTTPNKQGFNPLSRSAISRAPVYLSVSQHEQDGTSHIDIDQSTTASIPATAERWALDWQDREHDDPVFGKLKSRSRWISASEVDSGEDGDFLKGSLAEGEEGEKVVEAVVVSDAGGWDAHQVWGFEARGGGRRFVRRVVVRKGDQGHRVCLVYDWAGEAKP